MTFSNGTRLLVICLAAVLASSGEPLSEGKPLQVDELRRCTENLRKIYDLVVENDHHSGGTVPSDLQTIYLLSRKAGLFVCPADKHPDKDDQTTLLTSYEFVRFPGGHGPSGVAAQRVAIVFEKRPNHHELRQVLFADGSIRRLNDAEFESLRKDGFVLR
jgi:hypothetical protein